MAKINVFKDRNGNVIYQRPVLTPSTKKAEDLLKKTAQKAPKIDTSPRNYGKPVTEKVQIVDYQSPIDTSPRNYGRPVTNKPHFGLYDDEKSLSNVTLGDVTYKPLLSGYYGQKMNEAIGVNRLAGNTNMNTPQIAKYQGLAQKYEPTRFSNPNAPFGGILNNAPQGAMSLTGQQVANLTDEDTVMYAGTGAAAGAMIGSVAGLPGSAISAASGLKAGIAAGVGKNMFEAVYGGTYRDLMDAGVSDSTAHKTALISAGVQSALEMAQLDELAKAAKLLRKQNKTVLAEGIEKILIDRGKGVLKNTAEEVAQEGVAMGFEYDAKKLEGLPTDSWQDNINRAVETGLNSALSMGLISLPGAVSVGRQVSKYNNANPMQRAVEIAKRTMNPQNQEVQQEQPQIAQFTPDENVKNVLSSKFKSTEDVKKWAENLAQKSKFDIEFVADADAAYNGYFKPYAPGESNGKQGKMVVNLHSEDPIKTVFGHELTHILEANSKEYNEYANFAINNLVNRHYGTADITALAEQKAASYAQRGVNLSIDEAKQEIVADLTGEYLFKDEQSITDLYRYNENLFYRIYENIKNMIKSFAGTDEEKDLIKARNLYAKVLKANKKNPGVVQTAQEGDTQVAASYLLTDESVERDNTVPYSGISNDTDFSVNRSVSSGNDIDYSPDGEMMFDKGSIGEVVKADKDKDLGGDEAIVKFSLRELPKVTAHPFLENDLWSEQSNRRQEAIRELLRENPRFSIDNKIIVGYSPKQPGRYQVTYLDKNGEPLGDSQRDFEDLVMDIAIMRDKDVDVVDDYKVPDVMFSLKKDKIPEGQLSIDLGGAAKGQLSVDPDINAIKGQLTMNFNMTPEQLDAAAAAIESIDKIDVDKGDAKNKAARERFKVIAQAFQRKYIEKTEVDLVGSKFEKTEDLAMMFQVFRNPLFETTRYIFTRTDPVTKKKSIVMQTGVSSRLPGSSLIASNKREYEFGGKYFEEIQKKAIAAGADSFYVMHNHPSGNPDPSRADFGATVKMIRSINLDFGGHIIINSNKYALISINDDKTELKSEIFNMPSIKKDKLLTPSMPHASLNQGFFKAEDLAEIAKKTQIDEEISVLIMSTPKNIVKGLIEIRNDLYKEADFLDKIEQQARNFGSHVVVLVTYDKNMYNFAKNNIEQGYFFDSLLLDKKNPEVIDSGRMYYDFPDEIWMGKDTRKVEAIDIWPGDAYIPGDESIVKFSMKDSSGKQLSEKQQEFFKDSKVRDENEKLYEAAAAKMNKITDIIKKHGYVSNEYEEAISEILKNIDRLPNIEVLLSDFTPDSKKIPEEAKDLQPFMTVPLLKPFSEGGSKVMLYLKGDDLIWSNEISGSKSWSIMKDFMKLDTKHMLDFGFVINGGQQWIDQVREWQGDDKDLYNPKAIADEMKSEFGIKLRNGELAKLISQLYATDIKAAPQVIERLAKELAESVKLEKQELDIYKSAKAHIKKTPIKMDPQFESDIPGFKEWRKKHSFTILLRDKGIPIDVFYMQMYSWFPELFPSDITNPVDMLAQIGRIVDADDKIEIGDKDKLQDDIAMKLWDIYYAYQADKYFNEQNPQVPEEPQDPDYEDIAPALPEKSAAADETPEPEMEPGYDGPGNNGPTDDGDAYGDYDGDTSLARIDVWEHTEPEDRSPYFEKGENPARDINVPQRDEYGRKVSRFTRTAAESRALDDKQASELNESVWNGTFSYNVITDQDAINRANDKMERFDNDTLLNGLESKLYDSKIITKDDIALGERLIQEYAKEKDTENLERAIAVVATAGTRAGQAVQAMRLLKKLSPAGQLMALQKQIDIINTDMKLLGDNKVILSPERAKDITSSDTPEGLEQAVERAKMELYNKVPSRWVDKWNAWRYLSMLGNPKTHIRNVLGNAIFVPVRGMKNVIGATIEAATVKGERSKAIGKLPKVFKEFAAKEFDENKEAIDAGGKENIERNKRVFKSSLLEGMRKANSFALEAEDQKFLKAAYVRSFAGYLKANKISPALVQKLMSGKGADIEIGDAATAKIFNNARAYAMNEAQKATYRDYSALANALNKFKKTNAATTVLGEGLMPFTKTPINILKRGVEYSPVGILKGIKELTNDVRKADDDMKQQVILKGIDSMASGLSGTAILALGAFLASQGILSGGGEEDKKERDMAAMMGSQNYSFNIGDVSYTVDWLAPVSLPLFVGVELFNSLESGTVNGFVDIVDAMTSISEPMVNMSMLQGLNRAVTNYDQKDVLTSTAADMALGYFSQGVPTLSGQFARTMDATRRTAYVDKNNDIPDTLERPMLNAAAKVPGLSKKLNPYRDAFGREQKNDSPLMRAFENFISPGYVKVKKNDMVLDALQKVYEKTGDKGVLPSLPSKKVGEKNLNAKEYDRMAYVKGDVAYRLVEDIIDTPVYREMDYTDKAKMISDAYSYAYAMAKDDVLGVKPDGWIAKAAEAEKKHDIPVETYITYNNYKNSLKGEGTKAKFIDKIQSDESLTQKQKDKLDDYWYGSVEASKITELSNAEQRQWNVAKEYGFDEEKFSKYVGYITQQGEGKTKMNNINDAVKAGLPRGEAVLLYNIMRQKKYRYNG